MSGSPKSVTMAHKKNTLLNISNNLLEEKHDN